MAGGMGMSTTISTDLRRRIVKAVTEGEMSRRQAADRFMVSPASAVRIVKEFKVYGTVEAPAATRPPKSKLPAHEGLIREMLAADPDATLVEICAMLLAKANFSITDGAVCRFLKRIDLRVKKKASSRTSRRGRTSPKSGESSAA